MKSALPLVLGNLLVAMVIGCSTTGTTTGADATAASLELPRETAEQVVIAEKFERVVASHGEAYIEARDALLAEGDAAVAWLREKAEDPDTPEQEAWLAEILVQQATHKEEFRRAEGAFMNSVATQAFRNPRWLRTVTGRSPAPGAGRLTLPDEPITAGLPGGPEIPIEERFRDPEFREAYIRWLEDIQLPSRSCGRRCLERSF